MGELFVFNSLDGINETLQGLLPAYCLTNIVEITSCIIINCFRILNFY